MNYFYYVKKVFSIINKKLFIVLLKTSLLKANSPKIYPNFFPLPKYHMR